MNTSEPAGRIQDFASFSWNPPRTLWLLLIFSLLIRLCLINLNGGEYTDGIIQLQLWQSPVVFFPPGYSACAWLLNQLGLDLLLAGRLVSILASTAALYVFYSLARLICRDDRAAFWATLFLALSPIFCRWSLRAMTDALFCLCFIICTWMLFRSWLDSHRPLIGLIAWTGLATLVRYQGLYFVPWILFLLTLRFREGTSILDLRRMFGYLLALLPWVVVIYWIQYRGFGHHEQFIERGALGFWITLSAYYSMFETYILYWPWAVTFGLFLLGILGFVQGLSESASSRRFIVFFAITSVAILIVQSAFLSFQYRYLLPLVALWCILAAQGWQWCTQRVQAQQLLGAVRVAVLANLVIMTAAVLYLQRASFSDLTQSAVALRTVGKNARVVSDEIYREGVYNVKMKFWSGRDMEYYYQTELQAGDLVVLHNAYSDLTREAERIQQRFQYSVIGRWQSESVWGDYTALPLLPDIMVSPQGVPLTSNPPCMAFRFVPQRYYSVILRLERPLPRE